MTARRGCDRANRRRRHDPLPGHPEIAPRCPQCDCLGPPAPSKSTGTFAWNTQAGTSPLQHAAHDPRNRASDGNPLVWNLETTLRCAAADSRVSTPSLRRRHRAALFCPLRHLAGLFLAPNRSSARGASRSTKTASDSVALGPRCNATDPPIAPAGLTQRVAREMLEPY